MAANILSPPRMSGNSQEDQRALTGYLQAVYELLQTLDTDARITAADDANTALEARVATLEQVTAVMDATFVRLLDIQALTQAISNPPTQAEVEAIQAKVNEILAAIVVPT